ncbi:hypothetical protein SLNWT_2985 [Streptomyces albus]|uniref:Uncharacterized protein n=1 Tax=Streptomyces albus (strain ATCC 21838 / DSM 41398 / FERM P-419 / JCM 4703 / NBRC 107858) TaxID=1081613 RepID=A0A0B5EXJ0_STRA4|nr:hypothetical protein SLNWT_2985 [Streptomyces albus]
MHASLPVGASPSVRVLVLASQSLRIRPGSVLGASQWSVGAPAGPAGPALARASARKKPEPEAAVTSETSPWTSHRRSRAPWARATSAALAQAGCRPAPAWSAAARAARSAAPAAR